MNILGPNQTDEHWDQLFVIRRAMLLRSLLERKTPHLINDRGEAQIDNGVLRALLKISRYKHESRSMEAILEMNSLSGAKKWEQSHLPSKEQLILHVDAEQFLRLLMQDAFFSEKIEKLAMDLYYAHKEIYKDTLAEIKIQVLDDAPLIVKGEVELIDGEGKSMGTNPEFHLCRCGLSKNKPHCDGSHRGKFESKVLAK